MNISRHRRHLWVKKKGTKVVVGEAGLGEWGGNRKTYEEYEGHKKKKLEILRDARRVIPLLFHRSLLCSATLLSGPSQSKDSVQVSTPVMQSCVSGDVRHGSTDSRCVCVCGEKWSHELLLWALSHSVPPQPSQWIGPRSRSAWHRRKKVEESSTQPSSPQRLTRMCASAMWRGLHWQTGCFSPELIPL